MAAEHRVSAQKSRQKNGGFKEFEEPRVLGAFRVGPRGYSLWKSPGVSHVASFSAAVQASRRDYSLGGGPLQMLMLIVSFATVTR